MQTRTGELQPAKTPAPLNSRAAIKAWNLIGSIDWAAIPILTEMYDVVDVESFILQLIEIRDFMRART